MLAEIFGMDGIVVLVVVVAVLFGSSQIPKLARSLGTARTEFKRGLAGVHEDPAAAPSAPAGADAAARPGPSVS
ncbi:MAG TPA: twin-arginine translocase TatA/TatE family subunit [Acidimicrobiales bacterium]|nr:twin-arginine translocase TatA/TatE family subunit [Acidimicrobiales bacterium]